jgi:phosphomannomutase
MDSTAALAQFDIATRTNIAAWLDGPYDEVTKTEIRHLLQTDPQQLSDSFYTHLVFGTGGMRGLMGIGSNRFNVYTVRKAIQGLANYLNQQPLAPGKERHSVIIGHDSRNHSRAFASAAAQVLAANNIHAYLSPDLRPTPWVSFGCRHLQCSAGIMITASHNPPAYNGCKVYWSDGAQVLPPHDQAIVAAADRIRSPAEIQSVPSLDHPYITLTDSSVDDAYLDAATALQCYPTSNRQNGSQLKIFYSPLYGTGITLVPSTMQRWGFTNFHLIDAQAKPNGDFPGLKSPNPEAQQAMQLGIDMLEAKKGDIFIATDPDADRVGAAVLHQGHAHLLNGNQIACLCLDHVLSALQQEQRLPANAACIKTLPTTELFGTIAANYGVVCFDVLTGFKYIAALIRSWEEQPAQGYTYLFGGEESYGYLLGTYARDKDAVTAAALLAEAALATKLQGETLIDRLYALYSRYGVYSERVTALKFADSKEGHEQIKASMARLRVSSPHVLGNHRVLTIEDYLSGTSYDVATGKTTSLQLPSSDVLLFRLPDNGKVIVRPSGTEPQVKLYGALVKKADGDVAQAQASGTAATDALLDEVSTLLR